MGAMMQTMRVGTANKPESRKTMSKRSLLYTMNRMELVYLEIESND